MKKTKILLSAGIASAFAVAILYIAGIHTKDAPVQPQPQAAATCTHDHAKEPIVLQKLEAHLTAQLPVAKAYPDIANDPEAVAAMQLKRLQAVFPELTAFPANWKDFSPKEVLIAPYEDIQIPFQLDTAKTVKAAEGEDRLVQVYRNGMQGGYAVTAATSDEILTIVTVPGSDIFEIHVNKDNEVTVTTAPNADCATQEQPKKAAHVPTHAAMVAAAQQVEIPAGVLQSGSNHVSNVVFFYNQATLDNFSTSGTNILPTNAATLETRYIAHVEASNITLDNSNIPLEWNYVGAFQMPEFQLISDRELREPDGSLVPNADSPLHNGIEILGNYSFNIIDARNQEAYNFAMAKIEEVKADQSVFIAQIWPNRQGIAGLAWTGWKGSPARAASVRTNANYNTLAHELGHNFGCLHDRSTENLPDS
ncbi:hypothetical protein M2103_002700, partial [Ereboglobus sp. PH5-5]|uniref:reprolysin-like metallopeptidase n=1 Tax=Ereboglobus sp. PH5-5 TaxID=2940529 RepID=UPI0024077009